MNGHGAGPSEPPQVGTVTPALGTRTSTATASTEGDWLCAWCHNRVANETDRFSFEGKDEFSFRNPEGIQFEIISFSETRGCCETGLPTLEHTWFPDHAWTYSHCDQCGQQLGWHFTGQHEFTGLIKKKIVRSLYLRN